MRQVRLAGLSQSTHCLETNDRIGNRSAGNTRRNHLRSAPCRAGGAMNRADRFLWLALATVAVSPLLLAGCAALRIDHSKEVVAKLPSRHALARRAIEQLKYGNAAPFEVCADDACPKPTDKTLTRATQTSNADVVVLATALPAITPSSKPPVAVIPPEENKPAAEPDS